MQWAPTALSHKLIKNIYIITWLYKGRVNNNFWTNKKINTSRNLLNIYFILYIYILILCSVTSIQVIYNSHKCLLFTTTIFGLMYTRPRYIYVDISLPSSQGKVDFRSGMLKRDSQVRESRRWARVCRVSAFEERKRNLGTVKIVGKKIRTDIIF